MTFNGFGLNPVFAICLPHEFVTTLGILSVFQYIPDVICNITIFGSA